MILKEEPTVLEPYVLRLTRPELLALVAITDYIGGESFGPRGVFDRLSRDARVHGIRPIAALRELRSQLVTRDGKPPSSLHFIPDIGDNK